MVIALIGWLMAHAAPTELAAPPDAHAQRPQFSADGSQLAYETNDHEQKRIATYVGPRMGPFVLAHGATGGSGLTSGFSTRDAGPKVVHELTWSPAAFGQYLYSSSANGQDYDLFFAGGRAAVVGPTADGGPAWSADGRSIVFTSARTGEGDLYRVDLTNLRAPPQQLTYHPSSSEVYATWGPASDRVAYVAHTATGDNLWWVLVDGSPPVQLTHWSGVQTRPSFSPDGTRIAFYANHEQSDRFDLYVLTPLHLAEPQLLARDVVLNASGPTWTPDGRALIAVIDDDARFSPIVRIPIDAPSRVTTVDLGTVGNGDLDVATSPGGTVFIAWCAQGLVGQTERGFRRLYTAPLPPH